MKIWLINHYAVPPKYYPLARTSTFARYLQKAGHDVRVFAASSIHNSAGKNLIEDEKPYLNIVEDGIPYTLVHSHSYRRNDWHRIYNMFEFPIKLKHLCRELDRPDAIFSHSVTPMTAMAGIDIAHGFGLKGHIEVCDLWPESFVALGILKKRNPILPFLYRYERSLYEKADSIIFSMEGGKDYIRERGWDIEHGGTIDLAKTYYINNGIDLDQFDYNREHFQIEDSDLNNPDIFKMVYTGSIRSANCVEKIIPVAEHFQKKGYRRLKFLIWGTGDHVPLIEKEIREKSLTNIVLKGYIDKKYIPYVVSAADCNFWVLRDAPELYKYGMSANKSFDYLASGKPMAIFSHCGYSQVDAYHCGVHCHETTTDSYIQTIERLLSLSPSEYNTMCTNARKAAEEYDFKVLTQKLLQVLEN